MIESFAFYSPVVSYCRKYTLFLKEPVTFLEARLFLFFLELSASNCSYFVLIFRDNLGYFGVFLGSYPNFTNLGRKT